MEQPTPRLNNNTLTNALLLVLICIGGYLLWLSHDTDTSATTAIIEANERAIDSLQKSINQHQAERDSLIKEELKAIRQLQALKQSEQHIIYEYSKDTARINSLPAAGIYRQLADDIAADYRAE